MSKKYLIFIMLVFIMAISAVSAQDIADDAAVSYENQDINELSTVVVDDVGNTDILQEGEHARINIKNDTYNWEISVLDDNDNPVTGGTMWYYFENHESSVGYGLSYGSVPFSLYQYYDYFPDNVIFSYEGNYRVDNLNISMDKLPDTIAASNVVDDSTFSATFYDSDGSALVDEYVGFWIYNDDYSNIFSSVTGSDGVAVINPVLPMGNYTVNIQNYASGQRKNYWWYVSTVDDSKYVEIRVNKVGSHLVVSAVDKDGNNVTSGSFKFDSAIDTYYEYLGENGFVEFNLYNFDLNYYPINIAITFNSEDYYPANTTFYVESLYDSINASDVVGESSFSATFYDDGGNVLVGEDVLFSVYNDDYSNIFSSVTGSDGVAVIDPALPVGNYTVRAQNYISGQKKIFWWNITKFDESKIVTINAYQKGNFLVVYVVDNEGNNVTSGSLRFVSDNGEYSYSDFYDYHDFIEFNLYNFDLNGYPQNITIEFSDDGYYPANTSIYVDLVDTIIASDVVDESSFSATFYDDGGNVLVGESVSFWVYNDDYSNTFYSVTGSDGVAVIDPVLPVGNYTVEVQNSFSGQNKIFWWKITKFDESKIVTINAYQKGNFLVVYAIDNEGNNVTSGSFTFVSENEEYKYNTIRYPYLVELNLYGFDMGGYPQNISIFFENGDYYPANTSIRIDSLEDSIFAFDVIDDAFSANFTDGLGNALTGKSVFFEIYNNDGYWRKYVTTDSYGVAVIDLAMPIGNYTVRVENSLTGQIKYYSWKITRLNENKFVEIDVSQNGAHLVVRAIDNEGNYLTEGYFNFISESLEKSIQYLYGDYVSFNLYYFDNYPQNITIEYYNDEFYLANTTCHVNLIDTINASDVVGGENFSATFYDENFNLLSKGQVYFRVQNADWSFSYSDTIVTDSKGVASINPAVVPGNYTVTVRNDVTGQSKSFWWYVTQKVQNKDSKINATIKGYNVVYNVLNETGQIIDRGEVYIYANDVLIQESWIYGDELLNYNFYRLTEGKYNITLIFRDNPNYYSSNITLPVDVKDTIKVNSSFYNTTTCTLQIFDYDGKPAENISLIFLVDGNSYNAITGENGYLTFEFGLKPGTYEIEVINSNSSQRKTFSMEILEEYSDKNAELHVSRDGYRFTINATDIEGNIIKDGNIIVMEDYYQKSYPIINGSLNFSYSDVYWSKSEGNVNLTFVFDNHKYYRVNSTINFIISNTIIADDVYEGNTINATFLDWDGNPLVNESVRFLSYTTVNGQKKYIDNITAITDDFGVAYITITDKYFFYSVEVINLKTHQYKLCGWDNRGIVEINPIAELIDNSTIFLPLNTKTLQFEFSPNATGTVVISYNSAFLVNSILNGTITIKVENGVGTLYMSYYGDNTFNSASRTYTVIVGALYIPELSISEDIVVDYLTEANFTVNLNYGKNPISNASVEITIGNNTYSEVTNENGTIVIPFTSDAGIYNVSVIYKGNITYAPVNKTTTITINKINATINVNESVMDSGNPLIVNVGGDETGQITVEIGGNKYSGIIFNNSAIIDLSDLAKGIYDANVSYSGDNNYNNYSIVEKITINPVDAELNVTANPISAGDVAKVEIQLPSDASGNVTVGDVTVPVVNGAATVSIPDLVAGNNTLQVNYSGDGKYNPIETNVTISVKKIDTFIEVEQTSLNLTVGNNESIVASVVPSAAGNITYTSSDESIATVDTDGNVIAVGEGDAIITLSFAGNDIYNASENKTVSVSVNPKKRVDSNISVSVDDIVEGEIANVVVLLPGDATGNVTVILNDSQLILINESTVRGLNGVLSMLVTYKDLVVGNYTVVAIYAGDDKYYASEANASFVVANAPKENATINVTADPITEGENATITVSLPEDASGNVTVGNDTVPVVNGTATVSISGLPVGNNTLPVVYSGDDKYNPIETSVNVTVDEKVIPKENATIDIGADEITEGENVTVTVTLPRDASGNVTAVVDGKTYVAPVENGTAIISIPNLVAGNYTVPVTYSGDDKYNPVTKDVAVNVDEDTSDVISAPDVVKYFKGPERFIVNVTDYKGNPITNKSVNITINGVTYSRTTDEKGIASMALGLPTGEYDAIVVVDNSTIKSKVTVLTTVNGTDVIKVFRNGTQYYATFRDGEGKYLKEGTTVRFNINGVMYDRQVSGSEGLARLNINLEAGSYIITAINPENGEMSSNNITVISRLIENKNITKYYRNATQYTVKVIGDDGKAVGAGETVTFNINGVFYTRQTNASGIAKLNINLNPGNYIITAMYKDCMVSNNIEVLPVLFAEDLVKKYGTSDQFRALLLDGQGKPFPNQNITFNINGVFYNRLTDADGYAALNINLGAVADGYIITSSYDGTSISNKITIVP